MGGYANYLFFAFTKGTKPPSNMTTSYNSYYTLNIENPGTLIYDDFNGIKSGYENIVVYDSNVDASYYSAKTIRYMNIATLKTTDAGTYHCSAMLSSSSSYSGFLTSGAVTIVVNTKAGQAHSTRAFENMFLTYSALVLSASKLFF